MIKTQKRPLSKSYLFLTLTFLFYLPVLFVYFLKVNPKLSFLFYLSLIVLIFALYYLVIEERRRERLIFLQQEDAQERINLVNAKIKEKRQSLSALEKKIASYSSLKGVTEEFTKTLNMDDTVQAFTALTSYILGGENKSCILYLLDPGTNELGIAGTCQGNTRGVIKSKKGDLLDGWVMKKMQPLLVEDIKRDFRFDLEKVQEQESRPVRSLISVPLLAGKKFLGLLRVDSGKDYAFTNEDLRLLSTLVDLGAVAIENAQLYQHAKELSIKDGLTGLFLRRYLLERLEEEVQRSLRKGSVFSVLMIDVDKFKDYNDKFGHMAGDIVLKTVARLLLLNFDQPGNIISRYGGEEFLVVLTECHKDKAQALAEELRKSIKEKDITLRKKHTRVTVSIGVASFPEDSKVMEDLIRRADTALYSAKNSGRDKVCTWR